MSSPAGHGSLVPGLLIDGKYRLERLLGKGGMGVVFSAEHVALGDRVALKFLLDQASHPSLEERFVREARAMFRMKSQHVAKVHDVGQHSGLRFIVLEFLQGETLDARIARLGPLGVEEAIGFMLQICDGIEEAHAMGVIHRDIKPENIFVIPSATGGELLKVLDFGIAKVKTPSKELTASFTTMGTLQYMAPEQARRAENADERSDIWALGAVFFRMLTGRHHYYEADTQAALVRALAMEIPIPDPCALAPIPRDVGDVVLRCLRYAPDQRFRSVRELTDALRRSPPKDEAASVAVVSSIPPTPLMPAPPGDLATSATVASTPDTCVTPNPEPNAPGASLPPTLISSRRPRSNPLEYLVPAPPMSPSQNRPATRLPMYVAFVALSLALFVAIVRPRRRVAPVQEVAATVTLPEPIPEPTPAPNVVPESAPSAEPVVEIPTATTTAPVPVPSSTVKRAAGGPKRAVPSPTKPSSTATLY